MPSEASGGYVVTRLASAVRRAVGVRAVAMAALGVLAGFSIASFGEDAVALPIVGETPGLVVGTVGLLVAAVTYTRVGGCENCGSGNCTCGDSCSVDP